MLGCVATGVADIAVGNTTGVSRVSVRILESGVSGMDAAGGGGAAASSADAGAGVVTRCGTTV